VQIENEAAIRTALRLIKQTSGAFVTSVSGISSTTQRDISQRSKYFNEMVAYFTLLSIATSLLCLAAGIAIFMYVRRAVITRLKVLQQYMRAQVEGRPAAISTAGVDEITEMAKATQFLLHSGESLLRIIDDILDFSKIEAGRLDLELTAFSLSGLIQGALDTFRPQAAAKGLALEGEIDTGSNDALIGDPTRVRQILFNLLSNALKFTDGGGLKVRAGTTPLSDSRTRIRLAD
jgi:signal transduction histidine kinase